MLTILFGAWLGASTATAAPSGGAWATVVQLRALLGGKADAAKAKLPACVSGWQILGDDAVRGRTHGCKSEKNQQVQEKNGAVFSIGLPLESGSDGAAASSHAKQIAADISASGCTIMRKGQMTMWQCPDNLNVMLLQNYDSVRQLHPLILMVASSDVMLPLLGIEPSKKK